MVQRSKTFFTKCTTHMANHRSTSYQFRSRSQLSRDTYNIRYFQLWRSEGILTQMNLKYAAAASIIGTLLAVYASYFHMHISSFTNSFYKKFKSFSSHHLSLFFGLSSISWCGHIIHISLPIHQMLDSGIDTNVIASPQDFLSRNYQEMIFPTLSTRPFVNFYCYRQNTSFLGSIAFQFMARL